MEEDVLTIEPACVLNTLLQATALRHAINPSIDLAQVIHVDEPTAAIRERMAESGPLFGLE
jgi:hypothetical protein